MKLKVSAVMLAMVVFTLQAAKLQQVQVVDRDYLMVTILDGEVTHKDDGVGEHAFSAHHHEKGQDTVKLYDPALDVTAAQATDSWTLKSSDDANYGKAGLNPEECFRKTKTNGHAEKEWSGSDYQYEYTYAHTIYLKLPQSMQQGKSYTLEIAASTNSDQTTVDFTYDIFSSRSEAVHVNLVGYVPDPAIKSADLYMWMGDGGARDYSSFEGNKVYVYDVNSEQSTEVGQVTFWKASADDAGGYNLTRSDVWNADFSSFNTPGTYRVVIEGVGCSQDFEIDDNIYYHPYMVSVQGFFYMRIGQDSTGDIWPVPRRPLYLPESDPSDTKVYLTTMHPYHNEWKTFSSGDVWDKPDSWARFRKDGNPTNPNAWGGHSDALDWDRHLGHVSIIYDMLLPYILTDGAIDDDNLDIAESGNGIPDILDEARYEVDFWLRLRDGQGYAHGLTNPNKSNEFFQAAPTTVAAWANAANAAMLADCFRIAGLDDLMAEYRDSAVAAYNYASSSDDQMLDASHNVGEAVFRGRDLKMMAASFLYNVTGETAYEDVVNEESECTSATSVLDDYDGDRSLNQVWATAAYLKTPQTVNYPGLQSNMKASVIHQAREKEAGNFETRPSRRSVNNSNAYFRTIQNLHRTMIAHAVTDDPSEKEFFRKAMILEADYGLGRNPMNMIQMTTQTTPLEDKRSVQGAYTSGRNDGAPGMHPGHTPYMNLDDWSCGMTMGCPSKLYENCYPSDFKSTWPIGEGYFNTRYVWAHNEFTPQQTMRGKTALYGYIYGITKTNSSSPVVGDFDPKQVRKHLSPLGSGEALVRIHNVAGRVIWSAKTQADPKVIFRKLPLARGVYFLERVRNGKKVIRPVVKP
ncbi:MAG: cellulase N-terminal Ig-like domain-containing protein [Chitinispirillaceae bacterium]